MKQLYQRYVYLIFFVNVLSFCSFAQTGNFVTTWDLSKIPGQTYINFDAYNNGSLNYTWQEISPGSASGSGTLSASSVTISGLPANATINLSISPTNLIYFRVASWVSSSSNLLIDVKQWGTAAWVSMSNAFYGCSNLNITATDIPNLTNVTNMARMFTACSSLNGPLNINNWNTAAVTSMEGIFTGAGSFNQNIGNWDVSAVTNMESMFSGAGNFNQNIGNWNTATDTSMYGMFFGATSFNQNIGNWNTSAVTNMQGMFGGATNFNQNIGNWNTAAVTNMKDMFFGVTSFNQNLRNWNVSLVNNMEQMFLDATSFNQNIGSWNISNVTNMTDMLKDCGIDCLNYDSTLIGWANNVNCPSSIILGAQGLNYQTSLPAHNTLTSVKGWTIIGDAAINCTIGMSELKNEGLIKIFPNPTKGIFTLISIGNENIDQVIITNLIGQTIYQTSLEKKLTETTVNLSHVPQGVYFVSLKNNSIQKTYKLIIE